ncbi:MAG TPA: type I methionyl aminopeptidase [Candidatus Vogelbacteria bacterium]|nr:type I methionyl aminopeptidase [Candidatus Vogelbacteria bacterium]
MVKLKSADDIKKLREGGKILAKVLDDISALIQPGITTWFLEEKARELISKTGGRPAFLNFKPTGAKRPYPAALCVSINNEIVHGVPNINRTISDGDVVSLDLGLVYKNLFTDMAKTIIVGENTKYRKLVETVRESLLAGIKEAWPGKHIGDIGMAISKVIIQNGFSVVEGLGGHGVGFSVHEDPIIPNEGRSGQGEKISAGLVLAIEPMASFGSGKIKMLDDFTFATKDDSISAHFEHTIVVTGEGPEIITKL